jgi:hypothetical protein
MAKVITYNPTNNRITAKGGTEGDPITFADLYQADQDNGWGVVHFYGQNTFHMDALLYLGDGYTSTYFIDKEKVVVFTDVITGNTVRIIYLYSNAHIQLGELVDEEKKEVCKGCAIVSRYSGYMSYLLDGGYTNTYRRLYGCTVISPNEYNKQLKVRTGYNARFWHCQFVNYAWPDLVYGGDVYRCTIVGGTDTLHATAIQAGQGSFGLEDILGTNVRMALRAFPYNQDVKVVGLVVTNNEYGVVLDSQSKDTILTDCDLENWIHYLRGETQPGKILRKYTVNIHVADKDGSPLPGANVVCRDKDGNEIFNVNTNAQGDISEQEVTCQEWYQLSAGWHGEEDATCFSPHKLIVSKSGYETLEIDEITLNKAIKWHLELLPYLDESNVKKDIQYGEDKIGTYVGDVTLAGQNLEGVLEERVNLTGTLEKKITLSGTLEKKTSMIGVLQKKSTMEGKLQKVTDLQGEIDK